MWPHKCAILVQAIKTHLGNHYKSMEGSKEDVNQEQQEVFLIIVADTIVNPWTMVIHSCNAPFTNAAMVASWWLQRITFPAFVSKNLL